jgi:hypothetical protein
MANGVIRNFGKVVILDECPICTLPIEGTIIATVRDDSSLPDLEGLDGDAAVKKVKEVTLSVEPVAFTVNHDCRTLLPNPMPVTGGLTTSTQGGPRDLPDVPATPPPIDPKGVK